MTSNDLPGVFRTKAKISMIFLYSYYVVAGDTQSKANLNDGAAHFACILACQKNGSIMLVKPCKAA